MDKRWLTNGITRREALKRGLLGAVGLTFGDRLSVFAQTKLPQAPAPTAQAKSVIQIWMWGGPPHLETFDPKPKAGRDYCGPLNSPIATNVDGIEICQLLPKLAEQADKYSIIRSMTHGDNGHETAAYVVQTGHAPGERVVFPCVGSVVSLHKGYDNGYEGLIPPYLVLTEPQGRFSESGFLGQRYKPFATGGDPNAARFAVEGIVSADLTDERQQSRRELLHRLDSLGGAKVDAPQFEQLAQADEKAYDLILGDGGKVFDLSLEDEELRDEYGRNVFGQSCLVARRLVEQGVPYITINYGGWDTHKRHFEAMYGQLPQLDAGMATLLRDLSDSGLLDSTIVWWGGEFGRTPKVAWEDPWNGGRHHFAQCFSTVLAGGGFRGGQVLGASDAKGEEPAERPVSPGEVIGAIYQRMGIDPDGQIPTLSGEGAPVLPASEEIPEGSVRLAEIT